MSCSLREVRSGVCFESAVPISLNAGLQYSPISSLGAQTASNFVKLGHSRSSSATVLPGTAHRPRANSFSCAQRGQSRVIPRTTPSIAENRLIRKTLRLGSENIDLVYDKLSRKPNMSKVRL